MKRSYILLLVSLLILMFSLPSYGRNKDTHKNENFMFRKAANSQDYPEVNVSWAGIGELTVFGITNTGNHGWWTQPSDWSGYDGTFPDGTIKDGDNGVWPAGTHQSYLFCASLWVGGEVPIIANGDTLYWERRVDTGTYTDEWATASPLYSSIQTLPAADPNAGQPKYKQKYRDQESYQELWPYLDETVNARRPANLQLSTAKGDFLSDEDTYCEYGSFMPKDSAIWQDPDVSDYDRQPLGIKVTQRTYSWTSPVAEDILVIDFIIENKNDFPIRNLYAGYFMDPDIGFADQSEPQGSNDDLIGFDPSLSLGYAYDSDGYEKDWKTVAGYIGAVWLKGIARSPINGSYLTGFQTWTREGDEQDVENDGNDPKKYQELDNELTTNRDNPYEVFEVPQDVRMLLNTGPNLRLQPGQTDTVTVAIVMGESLSDLRDNTKNIQKIYDEGFVLPEAPPSPTLTAYPADRKVYLSWDNFPEQLPDPFTGEKDFEGYRVYRSETGLATDWDMLAEYDIYGTRTANSVTTKIAKGNTTARFYFLGFDKDTLRLKKFKGDQTYTVNFTSADNFVIYNKTSGALYEYNKNALGAGGANNAFTVAAQIRNVWKGMPLTGSPATTDPNYNQENFYLPKRPGIDSTVVYFDGMFFVIGTGQPDPAGLASQDPSPGDIFEIQTYKGDVLGNETGLSYSFVDKNVENGVPYFYAVTSFDRGTAQLGLPPLESSKKQNQMEVTPVTPAINSSEPSIGTITYEGPLSGAISVEVAQPAQMTGHQYQVSFFDSLNPPYSTAKYWRLTDNNSATVVLDSMTNVYGTTYDPNAVTPLVDGFILNLVANKIPSYNDLREYSGWMTENVDSIAVKTYSVMEPYDFEIQFPQYPENVSSDINGIEVPFKVYNVELNSYNDTRLYDLDGDNAFSAGDSIQVIGSYTNSAIFSFRYIADGEEMALQPGDNFAVSTNKPFQIGNTVTFGTVSPKAMRSNVNLNEIRVVPNPYYIRAAWDANKYNNHIMFSNLPSKCTIRIFTVSGILIKEIEHDAASSDPNVLGSGAHIWNLRNKEELKISSGLYLYQVESDEGTHVGKFAVIR